MSPERSPTHATVTRTGVDGHADALRGLVTDYFREINALAAERFPDRLDPVDPEAAAAADIDRLAAADLDRPLLIANRDGEAVGTVQLKRLDAASAEVKRLYVVPEARGHGVGRALMERVIEAAEEEGIEVLRLGVAPYHDRARELYADLGFEFTDRYEASHAPEAVEEWGFMAYRTADEDDAR